MELAEIPGCRSHELARRFLQTAVVIDDESYIDLEDDNGPEVEIVAPGRHTRVLNQEAQNQIGRGSVHSLNARPVIDSFSALGVICGVISPSESTIEVMKQADIVVLDWLLQDGDSKYTLDLFHNLVAENMDDRHALRLIAIYTGAARSPAGADAVERWIRHGNEGDGHFTFGNRSLDMEQTITLARDGLETSELKNNAFESLSTGFAGSEGTHLDEQLAWIMSFRTVFNEPPPTLWMGSVITEMMDGTEIHLICMRPRCDCIRLKEETSFLFLPLSEPEKKQKKPEQIIIRLGDDFRRLEIELDSNSWILMQFKPSENNRPVVATKRGGDFEFTDTTGKQYTWRGELKSEYAQRIAQTFATTMSRVAVDESEWLRRMTKK